MSKIHGVVCLSHSLTHILVETNNLEAWLNNSLAQGNKTSFKFILEGVDGVSGGGWTVPKKRREVTF